MVWRNGMRTPKKRSGLLIKLLIGIAVAVAVSIVSVFAYYTLSLRPVSKANASQEITIPAGSTMTDIAHSLDKAGLIRHWWAFEWCVHLKNGEGYLMAGTYVLSPSQSTPDIASMLTHGKVSAKLVAILPGQRIDQVRQSLIDQGFSEASVDDALDPTQYEALPVLADKPVGASLEGYLYPESFEKSVNTTATDIIKDSLSQMAKQLTAERRAGFTTQGLSTYQAVILASIVEKEAVTTSDRAQVAQVFLSRLRNGMTLGSDVTAFYGSKLAGAGQSVTYDTPYNTRLHAGLPPTPVSNVSAASLDAVANPSSTNWLYFVAGDDGVVHFSQTLAEHERLTEQYCKKLCN